MIYKEIRKVKMVIIWDREAKFIYLMDDSHGRDVELLMDILICNGIEIKEVEEGYLIKYEN